MKNPEIKQLINNILVHMYNSVVVGCIESTAMILRMNTQNESMNPRYQDIKRLFDTLGKEYHHLFFSSVTAIAEFTTYAVLDFIENYNQYESENNESDYPRLEITYEYIRDAMKSQSPITQYGSDDLGLTFKSVARNSEIKSLVDSAIQKVLKR